MPNPCPGVERGGDRVMKGHWMKSLRLSSLLAVAMLLLAACENTPATSEMPTPLVQTTPAPSVEAAMTAYLDAYVLADYAGMYNLLSSDSQAANTVETFSQKHKDAINAMSANQVEYAIRQILTNPGSAQATYSLSYQTVLFGDITNDLLDNYLRKKFPDVDIRGVE